MSFVVISVLFLLVSGCTQELRCERHFIPDGFIGEVKIYYGKKNGQKKYDNDGCIVYNISNNGTCLSFFPFEEGVTYPNKTFRYFEIKGKNSIREIQEFYKYYYDIDTVENNKKKYVYFISGGYENPNWVTIYAIDYGRNHKKYGY